jgi:hypothetical protein
MRVTVSLSSLILSLVPLLAAANPVPPMATVGAAQAARLKAGTCAYPEARRTDTESHLQVHGSAAGRLGL